MKHTKQQTSTKTLADLYRAIDRQQVTTVAFLKEEKDEAGKKTGRLIETVRSLEPYDIRTTREGHIVNEMGYAYYEIRRNGEMIEAGYDVEAMCDKPDCTTQIDRGIGRLCGETPGGDEHGCGGYFCGQHLYGAPEGQIGYRCFLCRDNGTDPTESSPDAMVVSFSTS